MIYKQFKIANQIVQVELMDFVEESKYGDFTDAKNLIRIAKKIKVDGEVIELTPEQIENTFWHEVFHAFQFFFDNDYNEGQAQVYSNFMQELFASGKEIEKEEYTN